MGEYRAKASLANVKSEFVWVVIGHATAAAGLLVTIRFLTSNLLPREYGLVALALTLSILISQLVAGPLTSSFVRFFSPALESSQISAYLAALQGFAARFFLGASALIVIVATIAVATGQRWSELAVPAIFFAAFSGAEQALDGVQNAARHRVVVAWHLALGGWAKLGAAALAFELMAPSAAGTLWAFATATALVLVSQAIFFRKQIVSLPDRGIQSTSTASEWSSKMLRFSAPFVLWGLFQWALVSSDRYALGLFAGTASVGLYNAVYQIGYYPVTLFSTIGMQLIVPILYGIAGDASDAARLQRSRVLTHKVAYLFGGVSLLAALAAFVLHRQIFDVLVGEDFRHASVFLPYMLLAAGFFAAGQIAAQGPLLEMNARGLLWPKLVTAIGGIAMNVAGAYLFGIAGVIGAGVVFSVAYFVWMTLLGSPSAPLSTTPRPDVEPVGQQLT